MNELKKNNKFEICNIFLLWNFYPTLSIIAYDINKFRIYVSLKSEEVFISHSFKREKKPCKFYIFEQNSKLWYFC